MSALLTVTSEPAPWKPSPASAAFHPGSRPAPPSSAPPRRDGKPGADNARVAQRGKPVTTKNDHGAQPPSAATEESSQVDKISNDSSTAAPGCDPSIDSGRRKVENPSNHCPLRPGISS